MVPGNIEGTLHKEVDLAGGVSGEDFVFICIFNNCCCLICLLFFGG